MLANVEPAPGCLIGGKYILVRRLAVGGMGSVWIAHHNQLDVDVAIKFMVPSSSMARGRFEREAKAAARLRSPHVVDVNDYGFEGDMPYIVMELLDGEDLGARLKRAHRISLPAAARIATQVAKALRRAHNAGMVHRDLKPGNIFLERDDGEEIVKILDFGVVKERDRPGAFEQTVTGVLLGTVQYMSPEQASARKDIDHRSDLWSLGVILFRAITGCLPFSGPSLYMIIKTIIAGPTPVPSHYAPDLSPEVDRFFERALARDPTARFQSAREMAETFARLSAVPREGRATDLTAPVSELPIALTSSDILPACSVDFDLDDLVDLTTMSTSDLATTTPFRRDGLKAAEAVEVGLPRHCAPTSLRALELQQRSASSPWVVLAGAFATFLSVLFASIGRQPPFRL